MLLSKVTAKPFIVDVEDVSGISIPQKYVGQIIKTPTQSYKLTEIDSDGNPTLVKVTDKNDLDAIYIELDQRLKDEKNRAINVEGSLLNVDSDLNNNNLVGAINDSYSKAKEYADNIKNAILDGVDVDLDTLKEISDSIGDMVDFKGYVDDNISDLDNRKTQYLEERDSDDNLTKQQIVNKDGNVLVDILAIKQSIEDEKNRAINAENTLDGRIDNEIDDRQVADNNLHSTIRKEVAYSYIYLSEDYTASAGQYLLIDTTDNVTITLPDAVDEDFIRIKDLKGNADNKPITVNPNGDDTIMGDNNLTVDVKNAKISLLYQGGDWKLI